MILRFQFARCFGAWVIGFFYLAGFLRADEANNPPAPITTVEQYWNSPTRGTNTAVRFRAQILYFDPAWKVMFFQDTRGQNAYATAPSTNLDLKMGQWVELAGLSTLNTPVILSIRDLGRAQTVRPGATRPSDVFKNPSTVAVARFSGLIRAIEEENGKLNLVLASEGVRINARICDFPKTNIAAWKHKFATITGVAGDPSETKTGGATLEFWCQSLEQLELGRHPQIAERKIAGLVGLQQGNNFSDTPVRLRGKVKQKLLNDFFILDDGTGEIQVKTAGKNALVYAQDEVEVTGYIDVIASKPVAQDCQILIKLGAPPKEKISASQERRILNSIREMRIQTLKNPSATNLVSIAGVITYFDPNTSKIFVQDDTGGAYLDIPAGKGSPLEGFEPGDAVLVKGLSIPGSINPIIVEAVLEKTGYRGIPPPNFQSIQALLTGIDDAVNVAIEGVVTRMETVENQLFLEMSHHGTPFTGRILLGNTTNLPSLIDAAVRLEGVATAKINNRREIFGIEVLGRSLNDLKITSEPPSDRPFSLPVRQIAEISQFDPTKQPGHRVHVRGIVTYAIPGRDLFLQDSSGAIRVKAGSFGYFHRGDDVQVVGFPKGLKSQPVLDDVLIRKIGEEKKSALAALPLPVILSDESDAKTFHGLFLTAEGTLLENSRNSSGNRMVLQNQSVIFDVILPFWNPELGKKFPLGSKLKASGICLVEENIENRARTLRFLVQDLSDLAIIQAPPWWNLPRIIFASGLGLSTLAATSGWVFLLRRRVRAQTATIRRHLEIQEALARLATELSKAASHGQLDQLALDFLKRIMEPQVALIASRSSLTDLQPDPNGPDERFSKCSEPLVRQSAEQKLQLQSSGAQNSTSIATPVLLDSTVAAVIFVQIDCRKCGPLADQLTLLQTLAHQYGESSSRISSSIALGQSYQQFSKIFHAAPVGISLIDIQSSSYMDVNSEFASLVGIPRQTIIGLPCVKLPWQDRDQWEIFLRDAITAGVVNGRELKVKVSEDICRSLSVSADTVTINEKPCLLAFHFDVTEQRQLEAQLFHSQRMESIGTLASGVAHDLNNVLAPILMASELIREENTVPNPEFLDMIRDNATRGAGLINQVLGFARGFGAHRVELNIRGVIAEVSRIVRETFPKSIIFDEAIDGDLFPISGDPVQIHQVLLNLFVNARDSMPAGGKICLRARNLIKNPEARSGLLLKSLVQIEISDTGSGIPPAIRHKIFDPFFTTKERGKGTGLGLSTAQTIVMKHGGKLDFVTEMGKGTTFTVIFPAVSNTEKTTRIATVPANDRQGKGELILLIDDEAAIRVVMKKALESAGYQTLEAVNGRDGVAAFQERSREISLVITDMAMPEMDGPHAIALLRKINPTVKILVMTGHDTDEALRELNLKPNGFLQKPFDPVSLLNLVRQIMNSAAHPGQGGVQESAVRSSALTRA